MNILRFPRYFFFFDEFVLTSLRASLLTKPFLTLSFKVRVQEGLSRFKISERIKMGVSRKANSLSEISAVNLFVG